MMMIPLSQRTAPLRPRRDFNLPIALQSTKIERMIVYVNDVLGYQITVFRRDAETGLLHKTEHIVLEHAVDNIEWISDNELWMGTIETLGTVVTNENLLFEQRLGVPEDWPSLREMERMVFRNRSAYFFIKTEPTFDKSLRVCNLVADLHSCL